MRAAIANFTGSSPSRRLDWFDRLAMQTAALSGKPVTFLVAVAVVALWAVTGPIFHYSDTWQLVINTGTTIVTFLMVFLIQATQNRDTLALQIKLSELILALEGARNELAAVEQHPEGALKDIAEEIQERAGVPDEALQCQTRLLRQLGGEEAEQSHRLFAVPRRSHSEQGLRDVRDLSKPIQEELEKFFVATDELEDKTLKIIGWKGPKFAVKAIKDCAKSFAKNDQ